jgi:hypothetical protein
MLRSPSASVLRSTTAPVVAMTTIAMAGRDQSRTCLVGEMIANDQRLGYADPARVGHPDADTTGQRSGCLQ